MGRNIAAGLVTATVSYTHLDVYKRQDLHFINLRNGMIDLRTMDLEPHHPSYYSTVQVPVKYNPDAKCPQFKRFLESVFDGDQERINLVQEIMGYVLTKERRLQKAFIFYGVGANGKSVLAEVIRHIAGPDNVSVSYTHLG